MIAGSASALGVSPTPVMFQGAHEETVVQAKFERHGFKLRRGLWSRDAGLVGLAPGTEVHKVCP